MTRWEDAPQEGQGFSWSPPLKHNSSKDLPHDGQAYSKMGMVVWSGVKKACRDALARQMQKFTTKRMCCLLGSLGFFHAFLEALCAAMAAAVKFFGTFYFFVSHVNTPYVQICQCIICIPYSPVQKRLEEKQGLRLEAPCHNIVRHS